MFLILFQEKTELNKRKEILMFSVSVNAMAFPASKRKKS